MDLLEREAPPASTREPEGGIRLSSCFQPIFSPAHRRPVGYEGLIRATDTEGRKIPPLELLGGTPRGAARTLLDRRCRALHVESFKKLGDSRSWLFLNVDPYVATEGMRYGPFFEGMLDRAGFPAHRVAVELVETPLEDEGKLVAAVEYYRGLGCLIVIDDFGAGYSNFDRIWRLKPDIVKIDREMTHRVTVEPCARRMFAGIVSVLHEAGALVCVEGIETEAEALCATDADADLVQGYYFARPAEGLLEGHKSRHLFTSLSAQFRSQIAGVRERRRTRLKPYFAAVEAAERRIADGVPYTEAVRQLLELDSVQRCYLIAGDGYQIGANREAERNASARDPRLEPLRPAAGTNWQTKPYFRRAIESPGTIQVTRPYLSVTGPRLCVTLSLAAMVNGAVQVLCVDLDLSTFAGEDLSFAPDALDP
jgi:EAL domain-containing protein (putative c-di-GMP-specific phosphodiesterase class I)